VPSPVTLTFHGAAGTVTGSAYLLEMPRGRLLIDCGMFQGPKTLKALNYGPFPFAPAEIGAVLLTHAHIDHSGLLPKLVKLGFAGRIHATEATADLLGWMLPDSAFIQEGEVETLNKRNARRGIAPVEPIYNAADADRTLKRIATVAYGQWIEPLPGVRARWWNAGHILGSGSIELDIATDNAEQPRLQMLFSGDLGPRHTALQDVAQAPQGLDYLVCESTYGDRRREELDDAGRRRVLGDEIAAGLAAGGNVIVPAFAIERSQELLYDLLVLMADGTIPRVPVFLDSPLAIGATEVFERHRRALGLDRAIDGAGPFRAPNIHFVTTAEQSMQLARVTAGAIIIAASGMCDAGRIRYHLKNNLWRPQATVLLIGYQAPGTLGWLLESGAERVRIHGDEVTVKARIRRLEIYSGHADRQDLLDWVRARLPVQKALFLTHGEPAALEAMHSGAIELGLAPERVLAPTLDQGFLIDRRDGPLPMPAGRPRLAEAGFDAARSGWDWHNDLSAFVLALQQRLAGLPGDKARQTLLRELRRKIGGP
jgi:metallo-beta-lactamase family protein